MLDGKVSVKNGTFQATILYYYPGLCHGVTVVSRPTESVFVLYIPYWTINVFLNIISTPYLYSEIAWEGWFHDYLFTIFNIKKLGRCEISVKGQSKYGTCGYPRCIWSRNSYICIITRQIFDQNLSRMLMKLRKENTFEARTSISF